MKPSKLRDIRGNDIAMIFQDPMTSLNPVHTIGRQLVEAIQLHRDVTTKAAKARALELLNAVGSRVRIGGSATTPTSSRAACANA